MLEKARRFLKSKVGKDEMLPLCLALFGGVIVVTFLVDLVIKLIFPMAMGV